MAADSKQSWWRRYWWRALLGLVTLAVIVGYAITQLPAAIDAANQLTGVQPRFLVGALLAEAAALVCYTMLTRAVLPPSERPSFWTLVRIDLASLSASHVLPGGAATAAAMRIHWMYSLGMRRADVVFGATLQSIGSAIVLNIMLAAALLISIPTHGGQPLYAVAAGAAAVLIVIAGAAVLGLTRGQRRVVRLVRALAARVPKLNPDTAELQVRRLGQDLRMFAADRRLLATATGWATANWLLDAAALWVFLAAFGYHAGVEGLLIAYGLANVLAAIPITPGGLGIIEGVLIPTLVVFGAPYSVALVGVVGYRVVQFWLPIPVGGLAYLSLRTGVLRRAAAHPPQPNGDPDEKDPESPPTADRLPSEHGQDA